MIGNNPFKAYGYVDTTNHTAQQLEKYADRVAFRRKAGLEGDGSEGTFAAKLRKADEYLASGESCGATDSIAIVLRGMEDPESGKPVTKEFWHNGAHVSVTKDAIYGNTITIGGSANPDWIQVSTSVGTVNIDMNDMTSLMKCLDLFSPEDINAILKKITEVKQSREALRQIEDMDSELIKKDTDGKDDDQEATSVDESVGVISVEQMRQMEQKREKKFVG